MIYRFTNHLTAAVIAIFAMAAASCSHNRPTLYPWGWEKLDRPTDSLMIALQEAFLGDTSLDSCTLLVNRFHSIADAPEAPEIEKARSVFWDARLAFANEEYERSLALFRKSLEMTDSAQYPYDAKYIHLCLEPLEGKTLDGKNLDWQWYKDMLSDLDFALAHDARVYGAIRAQYLCCFMTYSGNPRSALRYSLIADSLFTNVGRNGDRMTNRLNVASNRILTGDTLGASRDYKWIERELVRGVKPVSPLLVPLLYYNKWVETSDTTALYTLYNLSKVDPTLVGYNAIASAYIAENEIKCGATDSLRYRIQQMEQGLTSTDDLTQKAVVLKALAHSYEALGSQSKALQYLNSYPEVVDANVNALLDDRYSSAEAERQINEIRRNVEINALKSKVRTRIFVSALVLILCIVAFFAYRYVRRQQQQKEHNRKELEKAKRSELSMTIAVKERERRIEELRLKISALTDNSTLDQATAQSLSSSIRSEEAVSKADEEFAKVFVEISPEFHHRLRQRYPRIGKSTLRMAEYIAIGMDNSHIARVMSIRPESVKQNRWRLRQALGLDTDESLDRVLRDML